MVQIILEMESRMERVSFGSSDMLSEERSSDRSSLAVRIASLTRHWKSEGECSPGRENNPGLNEDDGDDDMVLTLFS